MAARPSAWLSRALTAAYVDQITLDHPELEADIAAADAQLAIVAFTEQLLL